MASRVPFTESQWEELENQALVFKYLVAGVPVPPHLLFLIRRPYLLSSSSSSSPSTFFFPQFGWNVQEMGRKIDAEPGRCRRTDGKKWRCSKEAYLDSKYCERHMHRGKNRSSRKPSNLSSLSVSSRRRSEYIDEDFFSIAGSCGYKSLTQSHSNNASDTEKHCFILGTDVRTHERPLMLGEKQKQRKDDDDDDDDEEQRSKRVYRFLDEWPSSHSPVSTSLFI